MTDALDLVRTPIVAFNVFMLAYLAALCANHTLLLVAGWHEISNYVRRRVLRDFRSVSESELSVAVSVIVPARNEQRVIVESVRALLRAQYPRFEVLVVNDGSTDETLEELMKAFRLVRINRVPRARLETGYVRNVFMSASEHRLVVLDKEHGGKADALNAGLSYARYPLYCAIDSDTMLEPDALQRLVWHFGADPNTVACGGIVRIVNGCAVCDSKVASVQAPKSLLLNLQIVEYLRAFLMGRTGWSRLGMLLIISGAFGLFRRETVVAAGGYDTNTVGEDAELIVRLHRHCREHGQKYRVAFVPDPVCWTEAPASWRDLARQRERWQRGLIEAIVRHRSMIARRRYGWIGLFAMPYFAFFEMIGPLIEVLGYAAMAFSLAQGWVSPEAGLAFFGLAVWYGLVLSFGALLIEERAFQRYRRWRCLGRLTIALGAESFGYRQWCTYVRAKAFWSLRHRRRPWGDMVRAGYVIHPHPGAGDASVGATGIEPVTSRV